MVRIATGALSLAFVLAYAANGWAASETRAPQMRLLAQATPAEACAKNCSSNCDKEVASCARSEDACKAEREQCISLCRQYCPK